MSTISAQSALARMTEGEEPEVIIRKTLVQPPDKDDPDQRGIYHVTVQVVIK